MGSSSGKKQINHFEPTGPSPFSLLKKDLRFKTPKSWQNRNLASNPKAYGTIQPSKLKSKTKKNNDLAQQEDAPMLTEEQILNTNESLSNEEVEFANDCHNQD